MRILIVEDDPQLAPLIRLDLESVGYVADIVGLANDGLHAASTVDYPFPILIPSLRIGDTPPPKAL